MKSSVLITAAISMLFSYCTFAHDYSQSKKAYLKTHVLRSDVRQSGAETARYLTMDYGNTAQDCDGTSTPAFLCSGVLLRGTDVYSTAYHTWDPSPDSVSSGGVSFSYLRADSKFDKLAYSYNNGYIFFPYFYAPDDEGIDTNIDIMCSFPVDGGTNSRNSKGCGASSKYPSTSGPCQSQGIYTADEWYSHYIKGNEDNLYQCGFTTSDDSSEDTAAGFYQSILSMAKIASLSFNQQNELRLATWTQGKQNSLPIEAFFYLSGNQTGLASAQSNQKDFYNSTTNNIWVPVIEVRLPSTQSQDATFSYNSGDQLIPEPAVLAN